MEKFTKVNPENKPEKESEIIYNIDSENCWIWIGGNIKKLGEFIGRLDIKQNFRPEKELASRISHWTDLLEKYQLAKTPEERDKLIGGGQLNYGLHRIIVYKLGISRVAVRASGFEKIVSEGRLETLPSLALQYHYNGDRTPQHFSEVKKSFEEIKTELGSSKER